MPNNKQKVQDSACTGYFAFCYGKISNWIIHIPVSTSDTELAELKENASYWASKSQAEEFQIMKLYLSPSEYQDLTARLGTYVSQEVITSIIEKNQARKDAGLVSGAAAPSAKPGLFSGATTAADDKAPVLSVPKKTI
jgi:hypothetical protein